jgi:hypothetical protein
MRNLIVSLLMIVSCSGCAIGKGLPEVTFEWFNLSTNEIWVTDAVGLPDGSWAGRLMPVHGEDQLSVAASVIMENVQLQVSCTRRFLRGQIWEYRQSWITPSYVLPIWERTNGG